METTTFLISLLVFFASLFYVFSKIIPGRSRQQVTLHPLPPGSAGWPILGETLDYVRTAAKGVPEKFVADRRKKYSSDGSCKVFKTSMLCKLIAMLCTPAGNKFLFSNESTLVKVWRPSHFEKLFSVKNSIRMPKFLSPFLKLDAVRKHIDVMDQVTKHHFDAYWSSKMDQKEVIMFQSLVKTYSLAFSCRLFLNTEDPEVLSKLEKTVDDIHEGMVSLPLDLPETKFNKTIKASRKMMKIVESMVVQKKIDLMSLSLKESHIYCLPN